MAKSQVQPDRVHELNDRPIGETGYVLYWMQQSQRVSYNHALTYAIEQAEGRKLPVVVAFGLTTDYPDANLRHYAFMMQGIEETAESLRQMGIQLVIRVGDLPKVAIELSRDAALVVCDRGYLLHQRRWRDEVADGCACRVVQVESDVVVPVEVTSDKAEYAARTIRPRIHRNLKDHLLPLHSIKPRVSSLSLKLGGVEPSLDQLDLDRSVGPSPRFTGGSLHAHKLLRRFIRDKLAGYSGDRSEPAAQIVSYMSPYLHFGQISPVEIAVEVSNSTAPQADKDAYIEELIVRRELACNYCQFTPNYWSYEALPAWARRTLAKHTPDRRETIYSREQLEGCATADPYWNAAMREMVATGYMHNYMRMYWGKCIIGWKKTPREAFEEMLYLNNKYFIDGRDPVSYANVAWCFGLHDRPWQERSIFGQIRYMNRAGLDRKFDMDAYVRQFP